MADVKSLITVIKSLMADVKSLVAVLKSVPPDIKFSIATLSIRFTEYVAGRGGAMIQNINIER